MKRLMKRSGVIGRGRKGEAKRPRSAQRHQTNLIRCDLGDLLDLSQTGMRIKCDSKPPVKVGQMIQMTLRSPGDKLPVVGKIVWLRRKGLRAYQIGIMFVNVTRRQAENLESLAMFGFVQKAASKARAKQTEDQGSTISATIELPNYFEILGLEPEADGEAVHQAYRALARKFHPDVCHDPDGQERFIKIAEAYEILKDSKRRESLSQQHRKAG
ncbi:MAG: DnaJ domain-containing protein [Planctomycetota bacterium]|jgi:hypothetical protein